MTIHQELELGNNHLLDNDAEFTSGFSNGNLFYYDTNFHPSEPLSCQTVYQFMREHLSDHRDSDRWNAGFVVGWLAALCENRRDFFFTSIILPEPTSNSLTKHQQKQGHGEKFFISSCLKNSESHTIESSTIS